MSEPSLDDVARSVFERSVYERGAGMMLTDVCLFVTEQAAETNYSEEAIFRLLSRANLIAKISAPEWTL